MKLRTIVTLAASIAVLALAPIPVLAQHGGGHAGGGHAGGGGRRGGGSGGVGAARGVPRGGYYGGGYGRYGGYGLGFGFGYADPWFDSSWYDGYPYGDPPYALGDPQAAASGNVRIDVTPRDAQVFVDGYYAGIVKDFNGVGKHLELAAGVHHIEVKANNSEPMTYNIKVESGHTITLHPMTPAAPAQS